MAGRKSAMTGPTAGRITSCRPFTRCRNSREITRWSAAGWSPARRSEWVYGRIGTWSPARMPASFHTSSWIDRQESGCNTRREFVGIRRWGTALSSKDFPEMDYRLRRPRKPTPVPQRPLSASRAGPPGWPRDTTRNRRHRPVGRRPSERRRPGRRLPCPRPWKSIILTEREADQETPLSDYPRILSMQSKEKNCAGA